MRFSVTILGSNSAIPAHGRCPSSLVVNVHERLYLVDCGEGTQIRMNQFRVRKSRINNIFISHLHGDHVFGLAGLLTSYSLSGRKEPMTVFSPPGLETMINVQLEYAEAFLQYPLQFVALDSNIQQKIYEDEAVKVYSIPLQHRIPTCGFLFREKKSRFSIKPEKIAEYSIPYEAIPPIKEGGDFMLPDGKVVKNSELTVPASASRSFAYCSDTAFSNQVISIVRNVNLLYHEATFMHDLKSQAVMTMHSTAREAATVALEGKVGRLLIGHFSTRYKDLNPLLEEARSLFSSTELAEEGKTFEIPFLDEI